MNTEANSELRKQLRRISARSGSAIDIRCAWSLATILGIADDESPNPHGFDTIGDCLVEAHSLGYREGDAGSLPVLFVGTPLAAAWRDGGRFRSDGELVRCASLEEWEALSEGEQSASWEAFHDLCAAGVGDEHPFYGVLMTKWMVGYAGH